LLKGEKSQVVVATFCSRQRLCPDLNLVTCSPFIWTSIFLQHLVTCSR
jgi:hypothetical protein